MWTMISTNLISNFISLIFLGQNQGFGNQGQPQGFGNQGLNQGFGNQGQPQGFGNQGQPQGFGNQGFGSQGQPQGFGNQGFWIRVLEIRVKESKRRRSSPTLTERRTSRFKTRSSTRTGLKMFEPMKLLRIPVNIIFFNTFIYSCYKFFLCPSFPPFVHPSVSLSVCPSVRPSIRSGKHCFQ